MQSFDALVILDINHISNGVVCRQPILKEVADRLHNKVQASATVKLDAAFHEQVQQLVPWKLTLVQIARAPKVRRLPVQKMMEEPVTHRAAVLQYATGQIQLESEAVESIKDSPGETFEAPVAYAVIIFGEAPRRSFDPKDDLAPEKVPAKQIVKDLSAEPQEQWLPHQPGVRDITFPGLQGVPQ